jgi:hypothetical protein
MCRLPVSLSAQFRCVFDRREASPAARSSRGVTWSPRKGSAELILASANKDFGLH